MSPEHAEAAEEAHHGIVKNGPGALETAASMWVALIEELLHTCVDVRAEVRLSALRTLFSVVVTHGAIFGDAAWRALFSTGVLAENQGIRVAISTGARMAITPLPVDQLGRSRSGTSPADIGAIEAP
mgnify:CR=1 FL=1